MKRFIEKKKLLKILSLSVVALSTIGALTATTLTQPSVSSNKTQSHLLNRLSTESDRTFTGGNLCNFTATTIDCSNMVNDEFVEKDFLNENTGRKYQYLISFDQDVLLHDVDTFEETRSLAVDQTSLDDFLLPALSFKVEGAERKETLANEFLQSIVSGSNEGDESLLIKKNSALVFSKTAFKMESKDTKISLSLKLDGGANRAVVATIKALPFLNKKSSQGFNNDYHEKNENEIQLTKTQTFDLTTTDNTDVVFEPLKGGETSKLQVDSFSESFLNTKIDLEATNVFKSYWDSFLSTDFVNGVVNKNKLVNELKFENVNMKHMAKDFLLLTNVRKLSFHGAYNFGESNITEDEWFAFFNANTNLKDFEFVSSGLTNTSFETIKSALERVTRTGLSISLENNDLVNAPNFQNEASIESLNLKGNSLVNVSSLDAGWTSLNTLNLSYNPSLAIKIPTFMSVLNAVPSLEDLNLEGMAIGKNTAFLSNFATNTSFTNLRGNIEKLNLANNSLENVETLFAETSNFTSLVSLNLSDNDIEEMGEGFYIIPGSNTSLILNNNENLDFVIPETVAGSDASPLASVEMLELENVKSISFSSTFSSSTSLNSLKVGMIDGSSETSLANLPNSLTSLTIRNSSTWLSTSILNSTLENLTAITSLDLSNNNLFGTALNSLRGKTTITKLNLSGNSFRELEQVTEKLNLTSLVSLTIADQERLNLNKLLWLLDGSSTTFNEIDLRGSTVSIYEDNLDTAIMERTNNVSILVDSIRSFFVESGVHTSSSVHNILKSNIQFKLNYGNDTLDLSTKSAILSSIQLLTNIEIENKKKPVFEKFAEEQREGNDVSKKYGVLSSKITLPETSKETFKSDASFASHLNHVNSQIVSQEQNIDNDITTYNTIDELEKKQEELENQVEGFLEGNERLLKNLQVLEEGTFDAIIITLVTLAIVINASLLIAFLVRKKKKKT